jgi:L-iditol 2-dehydrogenase
MITPPRVLGHEVCGEIVEVGPDRKGFQVGQRISMAPAIGCGSCYPCRRGFVNLCDNLKTIGFNFDGGFAEYMEVPAIAFDRGNVYHTPEGVTDEEAALAEPIACVVNGQEFLHIEPGDSIAIFGSGFIGCMHAELARMKGAGSIILIEPNASRAEAAHKLVPFTSLIVSSTADLHAEVKWLTEGRGVDVTITACPVGQAQKDALALAAKRGRLSLFGGLAGETAGFLDSNAIHYKELSVHGVHASTPRQNQQAMTWIAEGRLDVRKYITRVYSLTTIEDAFKDLQRQAVFKAVVKPA